MKSRSASTLALLAVLSGCSGKSGPTTPPLQATTVVVQSTPDAVQISLDGTPIAVWTPGAVQVAAGQHAIGLSALGYRDTSLAISLTGAPTETLKVVLGPLPGTPRTFGIWQTLNAAPLGIATSSSGPIFVAVKSGSAALLSFASSGALLGEVSLGSDYPSNLAATASGDVYLARYDTQPGSAVIERRASDASYVATLYYGNNFFRFPVSPYPAVGTGDTLLALENSQVCRYVNDTFVGLWDLGRSFARMAVEPAARRCYFFGATDTVFVYSTGGQPLGSWRAGLDPRRGSYYLTVAPDGSVYVADLETIHHFTANGMAIGAWHVGGIGVVSGIAVDGVGRVYVAGSGSKIIVRYVP